MQTRSDGTLWCRHLQKQHIRTSVVQTRIEAKQRESFDNDVFFDIEGKRTLSIVKNLFRSKANMFIYNNLIIEAKRSNLILNCESSEVKRTCLIVKPLICEAKRTCLY